jgi:3-hydroxyacyl-CoA dehydrogenase/enoyl-CoA hydratase/3-hydroxybutyryl-CoA epimerase
VGAKKHLWSGLKQFEKPLTADPQVMLQELKDRLLYRQAIETARCMAEHVLTSTHDANIGSIFAIGFPAWTGGAMQFIYSEGVEHFTKRSAELAALYGEGFALSDAVKAVIEKHRP